MQSIYTLKREKQLNFIEKFNSGKAVYFVPSIVIIAAYFLVDSEAVKSALGMIYVFYLLCLNINLGFLNLMFVVPVNELLNVLNSTSLMIIFMGLFLVLNFVKTKSIKRDDAFLICISLVLIIYGFFMYSIGYSGQIVNTIKLFLFMYYIKKVMENNPTNDSRIYLYQATFVSMAVGFIVAGVVSCLVYGLPNFSSRTSFSPDITINVQAITSALIITNLLYSIFFISKKNSLVYSILAGLCFFFGIATFSKSLILMLALAAGLILLFSGRIDRFFVVLLLGTVLIGALILLIRNNSFFSSIYESFLQRFLAKDLSNSRYDLWDQTYQVMNSNNLFKWFGAGDYTVVGAHSVKGTLLMAHNLFIETWVIYGFFGCALVFCFFFSLIKNQFFKKNHAINLHSFIPLIVMIAGFFYSHHFIGRSMSLVFIISFIPIVISTSEKKGY